MFLCVETKCASDKPELGDLTSVHVSDRFLFIVKIHTNLVHKDLASFYKKYLKCIKTKTAEISSMTSLNYLKPLQYMFTQLFTVYLGKVILVNLSSQG